MIARELAATLRTHAATVDFSCLPGTAEIMREAADLLDPLATISIARSDLAALIAKLASEHFTYDGQGAAALRAFHGLQEALETDENTIALDSPNHQTTKPSRT